MKNESKDPVSEFSERRQAEEENLYIFAGDLLGIAEVAYLDLSNEAIERLVVDRFIRGLADRDVKNEMCKMSKVETISQAVDAAMRFEKMFGKYKLNYQTRNKTNVRQIMAQRVNFDLESDNNETEESSFNSDKSQLT